MTKFENQLFADLMREYGPMLQSIQWPAATCRRPPSRCRPGGAQEHECVVFLCREALEISRRVAAAGSDECRARPGRGAEPPEFPDQVQHGFCGGTGWEAVPFGARISLAGRVFEVTCEEQREGKGNLLDLFVEGRLNVVVAVKQHGRRARRAGALAEDGLMAVGGIQDPHIGQAGPREGPGHEVSCLAAAGRGELPWIGHGGDATRVPRSSHARAMRPLTRPPSEPSSTSSASRSGPAIVSLSETAAREGMDNRRLSSSGSHGTKAARARRQAGLSWWRAMPAITRPTPARSWPVGTWRRTISPMIVAAAGSNASISANVARGSRAIASWSVT